MAGSVLGLGTQVSARQASVPLCLELTSPLIVVAWGRGEGGVVWRQ